VCVFVCLFFFFFLFFSLFPVQSPAKDERSEPRLQDLVREHAVSRQAMKEENEELRKVVLASVGEVSSGLLDSVNKEVAQAFVNEKLIESEIVKLQAETAEFVKRSQQWVALVSSFNTSLKEIGDVENWSRTIESDMNDVAARLEQLHAQRVPK
jgi:small-conductance mechanosensitive channel